MPARIAIVYYSMYGHVARLAASVEQGARSVDGVSTTVYQVAETLSPDVLERLGAAPKLDHPIATPDTLKNCDGVLVGLPTRFGMVPAQMKALFDQCCGLWKSGALVDKPAGLFFSTNTPGGGQETTAMATTPFLAHLGMLLVPLGLLHRISYSKGLGRF
ncbi:hypothetical protein PINS_up018220 [Pythium insidiosum]|nr:hypothetical protein PINS_up018220 [Pythium insidiosum]